MKRIICLLLAMMMLTSCTIPDKSQKSKKPGGKEISAVWISYNELSMKDSDLILCLEKQRDPITLEKEL